MLSIHRMMSRFIGFFKNIYGFLDSEQVFAYQNIRLQVRVIESRLERAARLRSRSRRA